MGNRQPSTTDREAKVVEFEPGEELGRGAYGRVFKVKYRGSVCAAKEVHPILIQSTQTASEERRRLQESFQRECNYCSKLNHPNIVRFIGIYHPPQQLFPVMIMELMDESLTTYAEKPNISFKRRMSILHDVAEGLSYLHSRNPPVIHRDLSPNNVLLKHLPLLPIAKIADLGVAKVINVDDKCSKTYQTKVPGTMDFMPPETFADKPQYDVSLDVFSYGGIMLHTVNGKWPTPTALTVYDPVTQQPKAFSEVQRRQEYLDKMTGEAEVLRPLVEACLHNDPVKRPSILELSEKIKPLKESPALVPALKSGCYQLIWEKCADLPSPLYTASVALHDNKVYTMAGNAPDRETYRYVYVYDINSNQWDRLPSPGQYRGSLQIINSKLTVIGGKDNTTKKRTNKVTTYNDTWRNEYPNLLKARDSPGVLTHLDYVIVAGGGIDDDTFSDDIELLNYKQSSHWVIARMKLPEAMWAPSLTISDDTLYIVGYSNAIGRTTAAYNVSVDIVTSTAAQLTSNQTAHWTEFPPAPHRYTAIIPNCCPPTIIGGSVYFGQHIPTDNIVVLDAPYNSWKKIASLTTARANTAVVPINHDSILVIGGHTGGRDIKEAKAHSISTVEKGTVRLCHTQ